MMAADFELKYDRTAVLCMGVTEQRTCCPKAEENAKLADVFVFWMCFTCSVR